MQLSSLCGGAMRASSSLSPKHSALQEQREPAKCNWQRKQRNGAGLPVKMPADNTVAARSATKISACPASRAAGEIVQSFQRV
jgi:hypothetical protein